MPRSNVSSYSNFSDRTQFRPPRGVSFMSAVPENYWDDMNDGLEEAAEDIYEKRVRIFRSMMRLHWLSAITYSIVINASVITMTSISIIISWPTDVDALNGLIGGVIGFVAGVILGFLVQRLVKWIFIWITDLRERARDAGVVLD